MGRGTSHTGTMRTWTMRYTPGSCSISSHAEPLAKYKDAADPFPSTTRVLARGVANARQGRAA